MREIKFRGWDKKKKKILEITTIHFNTDVIDTDEIQGLDLQDIILLQFTGLYDKNGKEIYEGDIIEYILGKKESNWIGINKFIIKWANKFFGWSANGKYPLNNFAMDEEWKLKIIGNIFENPELLKKYG